MSGLFLSQSVRNLRAAGRGDIIMISSVATLLMSANGAPYSMGKAAQEALARTIAKEERRPDAQRLRTVS